MRPAPSGGARRSVLAAVAVSTASVLPVFLVGALAVQMRADLRFSKAALGLAPTVFFAVGALSSAAAGRLVEAMGPRRGMRAAGSSAGLAMLAIGGLARSWAAVLALLVVGGMANALAQPGSNLLLARAVREGRRGTAFGIKQSAITLAMLLGGVAVPSIALTVGWRWAFGGGGALALATCLLVPRTGEVIVEGARPRLGRTRMRALSLLALAGGLGAAAAGTLGIFLVESSVERGVAEGTAGLLYAFGAAVGLSARLGFGVAADRRTGRHEFRLIAALLAGGAAGYALLAAGSVPLLVPGVFLAFGLGWGWPGLFNYSVVSCHLDAAGAATGVTQTGIYLGGLAGPLAFGFLAEHLGFGPAWLAALGCSAAAGLAVLVASRTLDRSLSPAAARPRRLPWEDLPRPRPGGPRRG